jgi:uncharacterized membrane protein YhiD involved in acid resistance
MNQKPLSELTDQELQAELKKRKKAQIFAAFAIGMSAGIAIWAATHKGGFLVSLLPFLVIYLFRNVSKELKEVEKEKENRKI